jgi:hypothetical protein
MATHLIKLCVGCPSPDDLQAYQRDHVLDTSLGRGNRHITRHFPRNADVVPGRSSLFWVMGGMIRCRQVILGFEEVPDGEGPPRCGIVLRPAIVLTELHPRQPFQGWRYLTAEDAPPDLENSIGLRDETAVPPSMRIALRELCLI